MDGEASTSTHSMAAIHWNSSDSKVVCQNSWGPENSPFCNVDEDMFVEGWLVDPQIVESIKPGTGGKQQKVATPAPAVEWSAVLAKGF